MRNLVHIGADLSEHTAENLGSLVERVFRVGRETQMDQETIRDAIGLVGKVTAVEGVTLTHSNFRGDVNMYSDGKTDDA